MKVRIKKTHPDAKIPTYAKPGDAGLDLTAVSKTYNTEHGFYEYDTGLAFEIPEGYVGLLFPRSSVSKKDLSLANSIGVLDSSFRGTVTFRFKRTKEVHTAYDNHKGYDAGDRIGQIVIIPHPKIDFEEIDELSDSERGDGGYGSTGE